MFNVNKIREDFPILKTFVNNKPLVYFDNAATTQKPVVVIEAEKQYYETINSNIHRAVHTLSKTSTVHWDEARENIKNFINAKFFEEIIFTRGTTESINLVAATLGKMLLNEGDEVIISEMEHHSNLVPWQLICNEKKAKLKILPMNDDGELILEEFDKLLNNRTKIVSIVHISNSLGTINPIKEIIDKAHSVGAKVVIDGAQSIQHLPIDVQDLNCDFFAFSGHKIYGPTGIGVLYGKKNLLEEMPPYQSGGDMILSVSFEKTTFNYLPFKYEAGTPNIAGATGLNKAIDYVQSIGFENIIKYETELLRYATELIKKIPEIRIIGNAKNKASVLSFIAEGTHATDIGTMLDLKGVAVRTGHHCTEPVMRRYNLSSTARASFAFYNTSEEVEYFVNSLKDVIQMLK